MAITVAKLGAYGGLKPDGFGAFIDASDKIAELSDKVTLDNSYPTGGYTYDLSNYFNTVESVVAVIDGDYKVWYVAAAGNAAAGGKLKVYVMHTGAEVANATDLSALFCHVRILGRLF